MSEERRFPWRTLLFLSGALNFLVVGAVVGAVASGARLERQNASAVVERMPGPRAFVASLPEEVRPQVRAELSQSWGDSRAARRAAAAARREAFVIASTEPYDLERVRAAFARLRAADQAALAIYHDNIAETFAHMTPAQRQAALAALRRAAPGRLHPMASRRARRQCARGCSNAGTLPPIASP